MDYNNRLQFEQDVEQMLKPVLKQLYIKYSRYDALTIHQSLTHYICKRNHAKILNLVNRRRHRKLKFKQLKCELENVRVEKEISEFEKNL
jgi:hypothetical protein